MDMPINETQQEKLFEWLSEKGVRDTCPACGCEARRVGDIIAPPPMPHGGGTVVGGPSFPLVQVICENCSFVMHFASTPIGLDNYMDDLRRKTSNAQEPSASTVR
jgi:hypothetical protein